MNYLLCLFSLLLVASIQGCETNEHSRGKDVVFYCRVCGSIIANYSSIVEKDAEGVDVVAELYNQEGDLQIQYDSFESSVSPKFGCTNNVESLERQKACIFLQSPR